MSIERLLTPGIIESIENSKAKLLDVRDPAAFNGWRLNCELRGGHIPGAANFPLTWLKLLRRPKMQELLLSKGVLPELDIIVYGDSTNEAVEMAQALSDLGHQRTMIYDPGLKEWAADFNLPMERLERFEKLVHPAWLNSRLMGKAENEEIQRDFLLFEAGSNAWTTYLQGHIPQAIYLDLNLLERGPIWNVIPPTELESELSELGIRHDKQVIIYSREAQAAARAALILLYAGVREVGLLDGGLSAWVNHGYKLEKKPHHPIRQIDFGIDIPLHPEYLLDIGQTSDLLKESHSQLICVRSLAEFKGLTSGYDYIIPRGRIAGSIWGGPIGSEQFVNPDNTMRDAHEIAAYWKACGIKRDQKLAFYCGTGWRASEAFFYAYLMGWNKISVYDGGWLEWSSKGDRPFETG
jgi:3-mercaptopyruvate sulfurtransferase SseA